MPRFAVAAGHALTAEAAERALRDSGTAVDACIAGALAACVAEPVLAGFFGGGFLMVRDPSGRARLLDFFVQTPRRRRPEAERDLREVHADFGEAAQAFHIGAAAIAAPGLPSGLWEAQARYGRLPMTELARPAAEAAAAGAPLSAFQARVLDVVGPIYRASPEALTLFGPDGDRLAAAGETLANPAFADVLEEWAREGPRFASEGEAGAALLSLAEAGGHLTAQDLTAYAPVWRDPTVERRGDLRLLLNPAPSLGGALIGFSLALLPPAATALDQACAFAATARARLEAGDAALDVLATPERRARWAEIAARPAALRGTTHISAVDASGLAAAMTLSNGEGCGLIAPGLGIMPNNMMGEADLLPQGLDRWAPDRRLASMMAPTLADRRDGSVAALGSGGSNRIRSAMASVLARLADGAPLDLAVAAPRVHAEGRAPQVDFEDDLPEGEREALLAAFPEARPWAPGNLYFGGVHAVRRDPSGAVDAAADARRD
ncbi:MAG: gamma-glutamyltransferase, partial [Pseudomonadota bacterium]